MGRLPRAVRFADRHPPRGGVPTVRAQVLNKITHGVNYLVSSRTGNQLPLGHLYLPGNLSVHASVAVAGK